MKLKQYSLCTLFIGLLILGGSAVIPAMFLGNSASMSIIGGADAPTYMLLLSKMFGGLLFALMLFGGTLILTAVFCLIFTKAVETHCNKATSAIALGISAVGGLGLICFFCWLAIASFGEMSRNPIEYLVSVLLGFLCFFAFLILIALYLKQRKSNWSVKGFLMDILTSIVYLPAFFYFFNVLYNVIC